MDITTDILSWHRPTKTFSVEHSTLCNGMNLLPQQINVLNPNRNVSVCFVYVGEKRDHEGEITEWVYIPHSQDVQQYPALEGVKLVVWND